MPELLDVKETSLYVDDLPRAKSFYCGVMGLEVLLDDPRLCALDVGGRHVLLLFKRGASLHESVLPGGVGIYEALMTGVLAAAGIPAALSLPVTVMYRVINTIIQLPPGYILYHNNLHRAKNEPEAKEE